MFFFFEKKNFFFFFNSCFFFFVIGVLEKSVWETVLCLISGFLRVFFLKYISVMF